MLDHARPSRDFIELRERILRTPGIGVVRYRAESYLQKFQQLLRELFQFDCQDLDFGIYRVLNYKRKNVELPQIVDEALTQYAAEDRATAEHELEQKRQEIVSTLGPTAFDAAGQLVMAFRETPLGKQFVTSSQRARASTQTKVTGPCSRKRSA
jgi:hypothetical protein